MRMIMQIMLMIVLIMLKLMMMEYVCIKPTAVLLNWRVKPVK